MDGFTTETKREHSVNNILKEASELLAQGEYEKAEELITTIPKEQRNAEWHFINGSILKSKGMFLDAQHQFEAAVKLEPDNQTYIKAAEELKNSANKYTHAWNTQLNNQESPKKRRHCSDVLCEGCCECFCTCICEGLCEGCDGC